MGSIRVINRTITGLALAERPGKVAISPAVMTRGRWWWKKEISGFAVQMTETIWEHCGAYVDSYQAWRTKAFVLTRAEAEAFARELSNPDPLK